MIFQSKNTKGKISRSNKIKNKIDHTEESSGIRKSTSFRFFLYFLFLFLGVIFGYYSFAFFNEDINSIGNYFSTIRNSSLEVSEKKNKALAPTESKKNFEIMYVELEKNQKNYKQNVDERINEINKKVSRFDDYSKTMLAEINNLIKRNEKKIYSDIENIELKINQTDKSIEDFIALSQRLESLEVLLNKKVNYFSIIISAKELKETVQKKGDLGKSLNNLKYHIENLSYQNYQDVFSQIEVLLAKDIKSRGELIILFEDIESSILRDKNLPDKDNSLDNPVKYFSSLVRIKKIEDSDSSKDLNKFPKIRKLLYQGNLTEAINEVKTISPDYEHKFENWIELCKNLVKFESLINFFESTPFDTGNNN